MIEYPEDSADAEDWISPDTFSYKGHLFQLLSDFSIELLV